MRESVRGLVLLGVVAAAVAATSPALASNDKPICLVRILGEPLPARHSATQLLDSTRDILEHERHTRAHPQTRRVWLLNRFRNATLRREVHSLLISAEEEVIETQFDKAAFTSKCLVKSDETPTPIFDAGALRPKKIDYRVVKIPDTTELPIALSHQVRLVTANNEARNEAIEFCLSVNATWIAPLDGNILIPPNAWEVHSGDRESLRDCCHWEHCDSHEGHHW